MSVDKIYFCTSQTDNKYPPEFMATKTPRYIKVIQCKAKYNGYMVGDILVHASFIEKDGYEDRFCIFTNETRNEYKTYRITSSNPYFKIWFTDLDGNKVSPDDFVFLLELTY